MQTSRYVIVFVMAAAFVTLGSACHESEQTPIDLTYLGDAIQNASICDLTVDATCLYPFPNDYFTTVDDTTQTGLRVHFDQEAMPSGGGSHIDPTEWNRNDGFSVGPMIQTYVPDVDLKASGAVSITDLSQYKDPDAPIVLIDAETGKRQIIWAELDANATTPTQQALLIRPGVVLQNGHRYIVALRNLVDHDGTPIEPSPLFRAYRDNIPIDNSALDARRTHFNDIFDTLEANGIPREGLIQAWDFTVASQDNITGRMIAMRDTAFDIIQETPPSITIGDGQVFPGTGTHGNGDPKHADQIIRTVKGTFDVPNFLDTDDGKSGSRLHYDDHNDPDALPSVNPDSPTIQANFRCQIPISAIEDFDDPNAEVHPALVAIYGHGLLGDADDIQNGALRGAGKNYNVMICATTLIGMSESDQNTVIKVLGNLSYFPAIPDRSQQGILNTLILAHLLQSPDGFQSLPQFHADNGHGALVFDPNQMTYMGDSQGGILGGAIVATSPDIQHGVLGEAGTNYSLMLRRFGPFSDRFALLFDPYYSGFDADLALGLMQMLWDRAENNGYLNHWAGHPLPDLEGNPAEGKSVLVQMSLADHQVTNLSTEIIARTIDAKVPQPEVDKLVTPFDNPFVGLDTIDTSEYPYSGGNFMTIWDTGAFVPNPDDPDEGYGTDFPPSTNIGWGKYNERHADSPLRGEDPHKVAGRTPDAQKQRIHFMRTGGEVINVCGDDICTTRGYHYGKDRQ